MKVFGLLALSIVAIGAIIPATSGLEADALLTEDKVEHLRHLSEEDQLSDLPAMAAPEVAAVESDENWHGGGGDGGCYRGSRSWPHCKSHRHLEEEPSADDDNDDDDDDDDDDDEKLLTDDVESHAWWHKGGGGCYRGSRIWPNCRRWGGRGD